MQGIDYLKAFGVALALMIANVAIAFGVMAIYGQLIAPGREAAFYQEAALSIAPWSSVVAGALLFFGAALLFGMRRPGRSATAFALTFTAIYVAIDLAIIAAVGGLGQQMAMMGLSFATKFGAALLGARQASGAKAR